MTKYQFYLKLAFLGGSVVTMVTTAILVGCGKDGAITNVFLGTASAFTAANVWQILNGMGSKSEDKPVE